ncbi:hypothetical protein GM3708_3059 [Geminocystis sp. NIES-3708]|uniref:hypothetical protein n=1 Tax=Geminocystis sp. NIES-3708 TaxID=1615909 RepID=UPI0005FC974B|nr:hypothetical protein [Geminocystis sp. NIES-3708]BAQ62653.1 hypothetical protein GM3708_3059 [Geminocystis sp. NIES-3708]
MGIVEDFEELKPILQEKWLNFCELNLTWVNRFALWEKDKQYLEAKTILLILISLEPKLGQKMQDFHKVTTYMKMDFPNSSKWLDILNISNNKNQLNQQVEERAKNKIIEPSSPLDDFRKQNL